MRALSVVLAMLLVTAAAAQSPYYSYYSPHMYPYSMYGYSTYGYSPYGYPYYSPYGNLYPGSGYLYPPVSNQVAPYYLQPTYVSPYPFERANVAQVINDLANQVQRLTDEVQRLQTEVAAAAVPPPPNVAKAAPPAPAPPAKPAMLIFKDGKRIESQGYAVSGDTLYVLMPSGPQAVRLAELDLEATRKENLERGIDFPVK